MSTFSALFPELIDALAADALTPFEGGRPRYFNNEWSKTTSDTDILSAVTGTNYSLSALSYSLSYMSKGESDVIRSEVQKLLSKQVISHCDYVPGEVISPVFTR